MRALPLGGVSHFSLSKRVKSYSEYGNGSGTFGERSVGTAGGAAAAVERLLLGAPTSAHLPLHRPNGTSRR